MSISRNPRLRRAAATLATTLALFGAGAARAHDAAEETVTPVMRQAIPEARRSEELLRRRALEARSRPSPAGMPAPSGATMAARRRPRRARPLGASPPAEKSSRSHPRRDPPKRSPP